MEMYRTLLYLMTFLSPAAIASTYVWFRKPEWIILFYLRLSLQRCGMTVKFIQAGKHYYCYAERGSPNKQQHSLVFVHGFGASKEMFCPIVQGLSPDIHIIMMDLPGHGNTTMPGNEDGLLFLKYVDYLNEFVQAVNLTRRPFHLVGVSMGGAIVSLYTSTYSCKVDRLTLMCPCMVTPEETEFQRDVRNGKCALLVDTEEEYQRMLDLVTFNKIKFNPQLLKGLLKMRRKQACLLERLFGELETLNHTPRGQEVEERQLNIRVPTQVIWGKNDEIFHVSGLDFLQQNLPECKDAQLIDNCGHTLCNDQPEIVTRHIANFYNRQFKPQISN